MRRELLEFVQSNFTKKSTRNCVSNIQFSNDFYVVEFPKSGITWFTVLLANTFLANQGARDSATFSSVRSYIPDLEANPDLQAFEFACPQVRFYKSHSEFSSDYVNVVYIARNPVDVMKSYYRYRHDLGSFDGSFEEFCLASPFGIDAWRRHVNSWFVDNINYANRFIHLVRYEDLVQDAAGEIQELATNFGWNIDMSAIAKAVDFSSRGAMREQEQLARRRNPGYKFEFVSAGQSCTIDDELALRINEMCRDERALLGYQDRRS